MNQICARCGGLLPEQVFFSFTCSCGKFYIAADVIIQAVSKSYFQEMAGSRPLVFGTFKIWAETPEDAQNAKGREA